MRVLALDLATSMGWAYKDCKSGIKFGTEKLHNSELDGAGMRFVKFYRFLEDYKDVDLIAYEAVQFSSSTRASQLYGGWLATLQIFCENHHICYTAYGVKVIKKFFAGKGTASKKDMIDECRNRGYNPKTDDEADAIGVLHLALSEVTEGEGRLLSGLREKV